MKHYPLATGCLVASSALALGCGSSSGGAADAGPTYGAGTVVTLASGQGGPYSIAVSAPDVYWANYVGSELQIAKAPIAGGPVTTLVTTPKQGAGPGGFTIDSTSIYWTSSALCDAPGATIMKLTFAGAGPSALVSSPDRIGALAVDAKNLYWIASQNNVTADVMSMPLGGGSATTLLSGVDFAGVEQALVVGGNRLFVAAHGSPVMSVPTGGGTATTLSSSSANSIAVDSSNVYWTTLDTVMKAPLKGGAAMTLAAGQVICQGIATDGANVYWANYDGGEIMKVSVAGGTPTTIASGQLSPERVALDATHVYWVNQGGPAGGTVIELSPK